MSKQKVKVPDSLRDVLLEFSIAYLLEQPGDVIDFAVDFFTKLQANRAQTGVGIGITKPSTPDESIISQDEGEFVRELISIVIMLPSFRARRESFRRSPKVRVC
jgi:cAMP-dependent protein kinase regulator